jgi:hypothetical protein
MPELYARSVGPAGSLLESGQLLAGRLERFHVGVFDGARLLELFEYSDGVGVIARGRDRIAEPNQRPRALDCAADLSKE